MFARTQFFFFFLLNLELSLFFAITNKRSFVRSDSNVNRITDNLCQKLKKKNQFDLIAQRLSLAIFQTICFFKRTLQINWPNADLQIN